jgi:hypothetical protein
MDPVRTPKDQRDVVLKKRDYSTGSDEAGLREGEVLTGWIFWPV